MAKLTLFTSVSHRNDYVGLNQIIEAWEAAGFIDRKQIPKEERQKHLMWVARIGGLVLNPSNVEETKTPYEYALCCTYRSIWKSNPKVLPWNFYPRDWLSYQTVLSEPVLLERKIKSIFSGTIRGTIYGRRPQFHERQKWMNSTEIFSWKPASTFRFSNNFYPQIIDYYRALAAAKFGLCPMGDVGICQREIETMGLGCIPVFTPGVEYLYAYPVQQGIHFIFANNPEEMHRQIETMSQSDWRQMSQNGKEYFSKHCTPTGLWQTVLETIERYNIAV